MWRRRFIIILVVYLCLTLTTGNWQKNIRFRSAKKSFMIMRQLNDTTEAPNANCICSKIYDPVCASNGKSYYNQCQMECENKPGTEHVVHQGNCIPF